MVMNGKHGGGCEAETEAEGARRRCGEEEGHFWLRKGGVWGGGFEEGGFGGHTV